MTTAGYGHKAPHTVAKHAIAIAWMLVSLVAELTAGRLDKARSVALVDLSGRRLAAAHLSSAES